MVISFSKKHSILLLLALIVFTLLLYFVISSISDTQDTAFSSNADISQPTRTPVANYEEAVSALRDEWEAAWGQAVDQESQLQTVKTFQISLQEIIIERTDQEKHLELVLKLSQLKNALTDNAQASVEEITEALFSN